MKRIIKHVTSEACTMMYKKGNVANNAKLLKILLTEQHYLCAYSEEYITATDARDVEHFNPNLKYTDADSYQNWFAVKHKINNAKLKSWKEPILHPTALDLEERIVYDNGDYLVADESDIAAQNLIDLIGLNDFDLPKERRKYINRRKEESELRGDKINDYFEWLLNHYAKEVYYIRAIEEEFEIKLTLK